jgi:hypothetical protein
MTEGATGMRRRMVTVLATTTVLALTVGGCRSEERPDAGAGQPATTEAGTTTMVAPPEPVGGLVAQIEVNRLYSLQGALGLALRNVGAEPRLVRSVGLDTPLFDPAGASAREVQLEPGGRQFVVPVPYGAARCEQPVDAVSFVAVVTLDDGQELRVPAPERYDGSVGRMHARVCAAAAVGEQVELRLGDRWVQDGRSATGELVLQQLEPGSSASLEQVSGSVLLALRVGDAGSPILRVDDDHPVASTEVVISVVRCDPHALSESKKTFVFPVWIALGDGPAVAVELHPGTASRTALDELLHSCMG